MYVTWWNVRGGGGGGGTRLAALETIFAINRNVQKFSEISVRNFQDVDRYLLLGVRQRRI